MKKIFYTLLLSVSSFLCYSQPNYFQTGAKWGFNDIETIEFPGASHREWLDEYEIIGDTIFFGTTYKKLHKYRKQWTYHGFSGPPTISYQNYIQFIRYDSLMNQLIQFRTQDSTENVSIHYNLNVGDTVPTTVGAFFIVDSIQKVLLFGDSARKIFFSDGNQLFDPDQYLIEGIGSSEGLTELHPTYTSISSQIHGNLICFQLGSNIYPSGSTCDVFLDIIDKGYSEKKISVFNIDFNTIRIETSFENVLLEFYNVEGKSIRSVNIFESDVFEFNYSSGIYFWTAMNGNKIVARGKLLH
jgi:hypothetical protein